MDAETDPLPVEACAGGSLRLGYVGHWADVRQTYNSYQKYIQPAMNKHEVSVSWDNTACKGLGRPDYFVSMFKLEKDSLLKIRQIQLRSNEIRRQISGTSEDGRVDEIPYAFRGGFVVKANQVRSIGRWDRFIGGASANFWLLIDAQNGRADDAGGLRTLACKAARAPGESSSYGEWTNVEPAP